MSDRPEGQRVAHGRGPAIFMALCGIIIMLFCFIDGHFGIFKSFLSHYAYWEIWEAGSLSWTTLFIIVFYFFFLGSMHDDRAERLVRGFSVVTMLLLIVVAVCIFVRSWAMPPFVHSGCVLAIIIFLSVTDLLIAKLNADANQRRNFMESVIFGDIPVVVAMAIVAAYHWTHADIQPFFSGAITFQFMLSNVVFVLVQGGAAEFIPRS